jgi:hypothetical protein
VLDNRVLRRIFGLSRDEVAGWWRKCMSRSFVIFYSSPRIIGIIKSSRGGAYSTNGEEEKHV